MEGKSTKKTDAPLFIQKKEIAGILLRYSKRKDFFFKLIALVWLLSISTGSGFPQGSVPFTFLAICLSVIMIAICQPLSELHTKKLQ